MPRPLRITFFGTYDEKTHPRVQVLREGVTQLGHDVETVNIPLRLSTAARVDLARRPWQAPVVGVRLLTTWVRLIAHSLRVRRPDVVVVGYLSHFDIHLARLRWPRSQLVLDYMVSLADTVRDRGIDRSRTVVRLLELVDRAATRQADLIVVDTAEHLARLPSTRQAKALEVPVGAPLAWLAAGGASTRHAQAEGPLRVIFFGLYTPLQGAPVIGEAIGKLAGHEIAWTMVGHGQQRAATEAIATGHSPGAVSWLDWVDADDLPTLVSEHDVCLGIFGTGPKALRVVPNKVYQGAAAGCAIVTSDTPPQRAVLGDAAVYVTPGDAGALATALVQLAVDGRQLAERKQAARARAQDLFTSEVAVGDLAARMRPLTR